MNRRTFQEIILALAAAAAITGRASAADLFEVRYEDDGKGQRTVIYEQTIQGSVRDGDLQEYDFPKSIEEHKPTGPERIVVLRTTDRKRLMSLLRQRGVMRTVSRPEERSASQDEVVTLVDSGPSDNRIDLVFMGDGYTLKERQKFFDDVQRMVNDMFGQQTFSSYLPLFNVHAVYRASTESGIGRGDQPKDTAYGLYRAGDTLRAIYPSNARAARTSCSKAPGCDYPIIIANDPYYGGLGGEFAISTNSRTSGTMVLRHELGHNFGRVGEEYDGGGYFGANYSSSLATLGWKHWATEEEVTAEPIRARFLDWPWHNLANEPFRAPFESDGTYAYSSIRFSASGLETDDTVTVTLDGRPLPLWSPGTKDRTFYDYFFDQGFTADAHELKFEENLSDGDNWVSSVSIHEYGENTHFDPDFVGAYPLFYRSGDVAGYRSNYETCLMRNMTSPIFCSVCQENNWLKFFDQVKLIDHVSVNTDQGALRVTLATQKLAQVRPDHLGTPTPGAHLLVSWYRDGHEVVHLRDKFSFTLPKEDATGTWRVQVKFQTPEVRKDGQGLLEDSREFQIGISG